MLLTIKKSIISPFTFINQKPGQITRDYSYVTYVVLIM